MIICDKCHKQNEDESKFCRYCGNPLTPGSLKVERTDSQADISNSRNTLNIRLDKKQVIIGAFIMLLVIGCVLLIPKINDYVYAKNIIKNTPQLEQAGEYQKVLDNIQNIGERWVAPWQKTQIDQINTQEKKYIDYKVSFDSAIAKENDNKYTEARDILKTIGEDYPNYTQVKDELNKVSSKIEESLAAEAQAAANAKAAAERKAQLAEAARTQAEAQAAASSQAAAEAETERQQEAIRKAEEVKRSFRNELTSSYNTFENEAFTAYTSGINYSNSGNSILALSQMITTETVLKSARGIISDLNTRYTGLPSDYYNAVNNMISAIDSLSTACNLLVQSEGTMLDYSSQINSYKNQAVNYANQVHAFLQANYY